jgi:hypothetical protein
MCRETPFFRYWFNPRSVTDHQRNSRDFHDPAISLQTGVYTKKNIKINFLKPDCPFWKNLKNQFLIPGFTGIS